ncbi:hypothetical protein H5410_007629 [Solanum commersonii]|uniref:DUF676 domain-containing protein n=1 Tax=Solanum commersonii TaxID=4109 RepID=A0A9J6ADJ0_SOLCO|nr:hypothetical protein H5410_007629 [Solanum commersonii]
MASSATLLHHYSPRPSISSNSSSSSSSSASSSSSSSSFDQRRCFNWKFLCFSGINNICRSQSFRAHAMGTTEGSVMSPKVLMDTGDEPEHLLVLVHGILASSCNTFTKTFTGIDGAGKRLADEVRLVVKKKESLKKISFLAHSLGGLIARYALGELYSSDNCNEQSNDAVPSTSANLKPVGSLNIGLIAGLEPVNFITLATPHLGVRGKNQLPFLFGLPILEKLAAPIAPIFVGQTGSQLFLTDGKPTKPPLLLRMASDCDDGKFISALGAFKWRVLYANVCYDHMVGWRTSSIRRVTELVKPPWRSLDGYKHVVDVEYCPPASCEGPHYPLEAAKAKEAAQNAPSTQRTLKYHESMEEEMIRGLQQLGWKKIDVSFHSAFWPFFAHNNIHVKNEFFHNAGVGVIAHVADHIKQQEKQPESSSLITPSLTLLVYLVISQVK